MNAEQEETFRNLWEAARANQQDYYHDFLSLAQQVRPEMTETEFNRGWGYCIVTGPDFDQSRTDFLMLVRQTF